MGKDVIIALRLRRHKARRWHFWTASPAKSPSSRSAWSCSTPKARRSSARSRRSGHKIFLDLKLHDIPNTVKKAMAVLSALDVDMVQPARRRHHRHDGGRAGGADPPGRHAPAAHRRDAAHLHRARSACSSELLHRPAAWTKSCMHYAENAKQRGAGRRRLLARWRRAKSTKPAAQDFLTVTPGVRFADGDAGDQVRVTTPAKARAHRLGLHRRRPPHHAGGRPRRGLRSAACRNLSDKEERSMTWNRCRRLQRIFCRSSAVFFRPGRAVHLGQRHQKPGLLR